MIGDGIIPCDSDGVEWPFTWMPWVGVIDDAGKAQKVPVRPEWQLTPVGTWQVPDTYFDRKTPNDDLEFGGPWKQLVRSGRGKWRDDWQEGWVCNQRTGLWVVDVDNPENFRRRMEELGIEPPVTWSQTTGRIGGGTHYLFDGRSLPEQYWRQGPLGDPCWGDLKCNGFIAAVGSKHPRGPLYSWILASDNILVKPSLEFADAIMDERGRYKKTEGQGGGGGATGRRNAFSATGENRNNTLISLRGTLFNLGYSDDEIREMLIARNEQFIEPLGMREMEDTVLRPKPNFVRHLVGRHASIPRLRVAPPAELGTYADEVIKKALVTVKEATGPAWPDDPKDEDAVWGDMDSAIDAAGPAAEILGGLGDLDLIDYERADAIIRNEVLPFDYTRSMGTETLAAKTQIFSASFRAGWNKGAAAGHEVPEELQAPLDAWHPPCPLPREGIEAHRLPPGSGTRWPVQNYVSKADDRGNARRLRDHCGDLIRFDDVDLKAYAFDGQRWLDTPSGGSGLAGEFADKVIQALPVTEAMSLSVVVHRITKDGDPVSDRGDFWHWLNAQQSDAKRTAMIRCASTMEDMRISAARFDSDPRWLNTPDGEIDLGRPEIDADGNRRIAEPIVFHKGEHYPQHYHSRITAAAYDETATCPEWEQALKAWLGDDAVIRYIGKLMAASLRGMVSVKKIPALLGPGNSGKSTLLEVLLGILGSYATTAQPTILRKSKGGGTLSDDLADVRGCRVVTTTETSGSESMDEAKIKRLSGGDRIRPAACGNPRLSGTRCSWCGWASTSSRG